MENESTAEVFTWVMLQNRIWTAARLQLHALALTIGTIMRPAVELQACSKRALATAAKAQESEDIALIFEGAR